MGHYASEMQCDKCGNLRCTCPLPPDKELDYWIVDDDFSIITKRDFLEKYKSRPGVFARCMFKKKFKTRGNAKRAALAACEAAVEEARYNLTRLKNICKVERPWEKK